jgi:hypothetical protein
MWDRTGFGYVGFDNIEHELAVKSVTVTCTIGKREDASSGLV